MILYLAIVIGQVLFLGVSLLNVYVLNPDAATGNQDLVLVFMGLLPLSFAITWFRGAKFAKKLASTNANTNQDPKFSIYLIRLALLEAPTLLSIVAFLVTLEPNFVFFALLGIALTASLLPPKVGVSE